MNKEEKKATRQSYGEELANLREKNNKGYNNISVIINIILIIIRNKLKHYH